MVVELRLKKLCQVLPQFVLADMVRISLEAELGRPAARRKLSVAVAVAVDIS